MSLPQPTKQKEVQKYIHRKHHFHLDLPELGILLVFVAVIAGASYLLVNPQVVPQEEIRKRASIFINERGQEWIEPIGRHNYKVAQAEGVMPRFVEIIIDPLDVVPGDTQWMQVVLEDEVEVTEVVAEIETDNGVDVVPLKLMRRRAVTRADIEEKPFYVMNGELVFANDVEKDSQKKNLLALLAQGAQAAGEERFVFEGEWKVHDTHSRTYRTKFIAKDSLGRVSTDVLSWSDACQPPLWGNYSLASEADQACTPNRLVDGVQLGDFDMSNNLKSFSIQPGQTWAVKNGAAGRITIGNGEMNIADGGQIRFTQLWMCDVDGDKYVRVERWNEQVASDTAPPVGVGTGCDWYVEDTLSPPQARAPLKSKVTLALERALRSLFVPEGADAALYGGKTGYGNEVYRTRNLPRINSGGIAGDNDCYDLSSSAHPGQSDYFIPDRGDGSYDYNCDGSIQYEATSPVASCSWNNSCNAGSGGWWWPAGYENISCNARYGFATCVTFGAGACNPPNFSANRLGCQ